MSPRVLELAGKVISGAQKESRADLLLRDVLRESRASRAESAEVTQAVFAYYRWLKWVEVLPHTRARLLRATELDRRFNQEPAGFEDPELLANGVPAWLHSEMEVSVPFVRALQKHPRLWLRARSGRGKQTARKLGGCEVCFREMPDCLLYRGSEDLFRSPMFHQGEFELQDLSSQIVGFLCSPQPGQTWWDACAGEGGKTLHLSDLMHNRGLIWSTDPAEWRLKNLRRRAARAEVFNYRASRWDDSARLPTKTRFDGVLIDAPCSGVGTWQRNPHARWTTTPRDVAELAVIQLNLLRKVSSSLKPGGKLVYSVCTLTGSETIQVLEEFERTVPGFTRINLLHPLRAGTGPIPYLRISPEEHGGNGMFIAAWTRL